MLSKNTVSGIAATLFSFLLITVGCNTNAKQANKGSEEENKARLDSVRIAIKADEKSAKIAAIMQQKFASGLNGNVLVAQKDILLYQSASGFADFQDTIKLMNDSKFQLASLSKTFTSIATLKLVEAGKLSLTTTIDDLYPNFPYKGVTVHSLLCHRSGLPYYEYLMDVETKQKKWHPTNQEMIRWFETQNPAPKPYNLPDHFFSYNNTNFAILAAIVEKSSELSFDDFLHQEILVPLGMNDTYTVTTKNKEINTNRTVGYDSHGRIGEDYYDNIVGDKGIYSTTSDLLKWYKGLRDGKVLSKELLQEAFTPRSFEHPGVRNYGYGFRLWVTKEQRTDYVYHTGWWKGYNTIMFFDLRSDFVVVLLTNRLNRSVYHIKEIIDVLNEGGEAAVVEENILDS